MNFFERQQHARQSTTALVLLFMLAVAAIVLATNVVVLAVGMFVSQNGHVGPTGLGPWLNAHPRALLWTSLLTVAFIGGASLYRMASLAGGGAAVAQALGGTLVESASRDPLRRQLINVVEEMAIAAGVPVPQVYVLDNESGINAFAAGFSTSDAAVAVTRGTLEALTREELQGVIAHEFSHILNGDMRLNMRMLGVTFGILVVGLTGRMILRGLSRVRGSSGRGSGNVVLLALTAGLALTVIGYIGVLIANLIKAAVSRHREYLADASAVQFTRNPDGIAGTLKKIAAQTHPAALAAPEGEEISHMLIADGSGLASLFASHPPLFERIRAIDPGFRPSEIDALRRAPRPAPPAPLPEPVAAGSKPGAAVALAPLMVVAAIGSPGQAQLSAAVARHAAIPNVLRDAAHVPERAVALVLALVLSTGTQVRARQLAYIREHVRLGAVTPADIEILIGDIERLDPMLRLPLLEIAFPALRRYPHDRLAGLLSLVAELQRLDGEISVFDFALGRLLRVQLTEAMAPRAGAARTDAKLKLHKLRAEAHTLLSAIAEVGHADERSARAAFDAGMRQLLPMNPPSYAPLPSGWIEALDPALTRLDRLPPLVKQVLVEALVITVSHDQQVTLGEAELLRTVCASLHCPLPPLVTGAV